jgi:hypothetical protein
MEVSGRNLEADGDFEGSYKGCRALVKMELVEDYLESPNHFQEVFGHKAGGNEKAN